MKTSETIQAISKSLVKFQGAVKNIKSEAINPHFGHKYADLGGIMDAIREPLTAAGLSIIQSPQADGNKITMTTRILHESGEWIENELTMQSPDASPQRIGGVITYGRRYALSSMLALATDEDDDGNTAQGKAAEKQAPRPTTPQSKPEQPAQTKPVPVEKMGPDNLKLAIDQINSYVKQDLVSVPDVKAYFRMVAKRAVNGIEDLTEKEIKEALMKIKNHAGKKAIQNAEKQPESADFTPPDASEFQN